MKLQIDSCLAFSRIQSPASHLHRLYSLQRFKGSKFYFKFFVLCALPPERKGTFFMHLFSFGLSQISLKVQFNIQLIPSFIEGYPIIWAGMNKVFSHHSDPYLLIHCCMSIPAITFPPIQQTRAPLCKGDVRLGPSTGCIAELSLTNLKNCFTHVILLQL